MAVAMMKKMCMVAVVVCCVLLLLTTTTTVSANKGSCIGCTMVVTILGQLSHFFDGSNGDSAAAVQQWCRALTGAAAGSENNALTAICMGALAPIIPTIEEDWRASKDPDWTCANSLKMCEGDEKLCRLWETGWDWGPWKPNVASTTTTTTTTTPPPQTKATTTAEQAQFRQVQEYFFDFFPTTLRLTEPSERFANIDPVDFLPMLAAYSGQTKFAKEYITTLHEAILQNRQQEKDKLDEAKWFLKPWLDLDKDGHSTYSKLRGSDWRGKDCDDTDGDVYPGRKVNTGKDASADHNCNGISGVNPANQMTWEDQFCSNVTNYGVVALGDSATAGFAIPRCWLEARCIFDIGHHAYTGLLDVVMNEMDWPQCAAATGFDGNRCPTLARTLTPFNSVYSYAVNRNPCIHRDYANIGVNGARSTSMTPGVNNDGIITSFTRNQTHDNPVHVFFQLIGNDVCNKDSAVESMTSEADFYEAYKASLQYLDTQLPKGSHVFLGGLVDGTLLYDIMAERTHPLGMKYKVFYEYLNCHNTSPCHGWLTTDAAVRQRTTAHARKLNLQLKRLADEEANSHPNFKVHYNDVEGMLNKILTNARDKGHDLSRYLEPIDSFHPSSTTLSFLATEMIARAEATNPEFFPINPYAAQIRDKFGKDLNGH